MRTFCFILVGVVVGWAASGVDWTRDAVGQDTQLDPGPLYDGRAETITVKLSPTPSSGEHTGQQEPGHPNSAEGTTAVTPQKGLVDLLGAAQMSAGIGRYNLKVAGSGYYVIDSLTGRVWHGTGANRPQLIAAELPQK